MAYQVKRAQSWEELWTIFAAHPDAYPIAGGTDIIPRVNQGIESHELYVIIDGLPDMRGVTVLADGGIRIGALTKLVEIGEKDALSGFRALREACSRVASPQIRNQATLGGNVLQENRCVYFNQSVSWRREEPCFKLGGNRCYQYQRSPECVALFQSDAAPALIACGAYAEWKSPRGVRTSPLEELYLPAGRKAKEKDEILTALIIPKAGGKLRSAYVRQTIRKSFDFPLISCAVALWTENGTIQKAAVVIGSAGVRPQIAEDASRLLLGKTLSEAAAESEKVQDLAAKKIMPFKDSRVDGPTRKALGKDAVKRALMESCCSEQ